MSSTAKPAKPDDSTTGRHIPALDGIRGLALLLVLMVHMLWSNPYVSGPWIVRVLARAHMYGWMGVDLFFVLSGFLITGILYDTLDDRHFFRNFYARRILRIFPLYYGFLLLVVVVTLATGHQVGWSTMVYFLTYTQSLVLHPVHALSTVPWINVNHFWSLAIEEQFYLMWPCAIFLLRTRRRIAIAAVCGALLSVLVRIICVHYGLNRMQPYIVYSWTPSHLDGLFLGGLLAMLVRSRCRETLLRFGPTLFGFALLGLILFDLRYSVNNFLVLDDPTAAVCGLLLVAMAAVTLVTATLKSGSVAQRVFATPVLRFFGRYSYGAYVYHYSITEYFSGMRPLVFAATHSKILAVILPAAAAFVVTMVVAWLSFRFFESKFLALKGRFHAERGDRTLREALR